MSASERARAYLERRGWASAELVAIQGDASTRSYFRAGLAGRTEILLVEPEPGGGRVEAFLSNARFLDDLGLGPPRVLDEAPDLGILALEDLGDISLRRALESAASDQTRSALFAASLELLTRLQGEGTARLGPGVGAFHVHFDESVFTRELRMFEQRYLYDLLQLDRNGEENEALTGSLLWLARELAGAPAVLTHRDFHIDNIHLLAGRLRLIDFQDARWGPASYDPASLLNDRDVHRFLLPGDPERLLGRFVAARGLDEVAFLREYRLAVVQRSLKAIGTFADQALARSRRHYLAYVEMSLRRAQAAARHFEPLGPVVALTERLLTL